MFDVDIRAALKWKILRRYLDDPNTMVFDEVGLRHGAARVDLIVVNSYLHGFELKSERDTLRRLPEQARVYNSVLDRVTLIVCPRHVDAATQIVPGWWGIKLVDKGPRGGIHFSEVRRAHKNPAPNMLAVAKLLWRDEAMAVLEEYGGSKGFHSKPRSALYSRIVEILDSETLRAMVRQQLRCRTNWKSAEPQKLNGG